MNNFYDINKTNVTDTDFPETEKGYIYRFDNVWIDGLSRTGEQFFEWDVQLSSKGKKQIGRLTRDRSHANVSLNSGITHK